MGRIDEFMNEYYMSQRKCVTLGPQYCGLSCACTASEFAVDLRCSGAMTERYRVAVGSRNPAKVTAAANGIKSAFAIDIAEQIHAEGFDVSSGVSNQPMGDEETKVGAKNRALAAFSAYSVHHGCNPHFSVGMEGGCEVTTQGMGQQLQCFAWMAVYDGKRMGTSRTAAFALPPRICDLVLSKGMELGDADDAVFGSTNSKLSGGTVGHLTKEVIGRAAYYEHAVVLACIPFHWPELYHDSVAAVEK